MAAKRDKRIDSVTFFATQVDFSEAGDMQIFVDKAKLAALEDAMAKTGYLDGVKMANTFNMLRPNELVWNYIVNNYVKGVDPAAFDLSGLERGQHPHPARQPLVLPAQLLSREQSHARRDGDRRREARSEKGDDSDL